VKDQRLFAKFALDFADSRKVLPLSDAAFRCLVEAIIWSRKEMSDGWLARRLALAKWSLDSLHELSTNDPDNPSLIESEEGWQIHDYDSIQETKAEIEARQERNRIAGQKGGLARAKRSAKRGAKPTVSDLPSETQAETEKETEVTTAKAVVSPRKRGPRPKPKSYLPDEYMPEPKTIQAIRAEFPRATNDDLEYQTRKFRDHWAKVGKQMADWDATWRNWMRTSNERGELGQRTHLRAVNGGGSVIDDKVQGWMDLANASPGRELE
jgi:hypothetical protein